jgi:hypothetical protein
MKAGKSKVLNVGIALGITLAMGALQPAWADESGVINGDFETSDLFGWENSAGEVGVLPFNVLDGRWSAFISTGGDAIGDANSFLEDRIAFPRFQYDAIEVSFLVRYKTDEDVTDKYLFWEDPFYAELVTGSGALDLIAIKTDGMSWNGSYTRVTDLNTRRLLSPFRPTKPSFHPDNGPYSWESHTLLVQSRVANLRRTCDGVRMKFSISDWVDQAVDSAAFIDDVKVTFKTSRSARLCPPAPPVTGPDQPHG